MATHIRISCINKTDRSSAHERIRNVGVLNGDGTRWKRSVDDVIALIENGTYSFYVERPAGDRVAVIVAKSASGRKYLKTTADGDQPNNLLNLPECP